MDAVAVTLAAVALCLAAAALVTLVLRGSGEGPTRTATASSLVGELVVAHTPRPDEQSIRGVVVGDHDRASGRSLLLAQAVYLVATPDGGVEELKGGDVLVERVSSVQLLARPAA